MNKRRARKLNGKGGHKGPKVPRKRHFPLLFQQKLLLKKRKAKHPLRHTNINLFKMIFSIWTCMTYYFLSTKEQIIFKIQTIPE